MDYYLALISRLIPDKESESFPAYIWRSGGEYSFQAAQTFQQLAFHLNPHEIKKPFSFSDPLFFLISIRDERRARVYTVKEASEEDKKEFRDSLETLLIRPD